MRRFHCHNFKHVRKIWNGPMVMCIARAHAALLTDMPRCSQVQIMIANRVEHLSSKRKNSWSLCVLIQCVEPIRATSKEVQSLLLTAVMQHMSVETAKIWGGTFRCIVRMNSLHASGGKILAFLHNYTPVLCSRNITQAQTVSNILCSSEYAPNISGASTQRAHRSVCKQQLQAPASMASHNKKNLPDVWKKMGQFKNIIKLIYKEHLHRADTTCAALRLETASSKVSSTRCSPSSQYSPSLPRCVPSQRRRSQWKPRQIEVLPFQRRQKKRQIRNSCTRFFACSTSIIEAISGRAPRPDRLTRATAIEPSSCCSLRAFYFSFAF